MTTQMSELEQIISGIKSAEGLTARKKSNSC